MNWTEIFIVVIFLAIFVFDVVIMMKKGKSESISAHIIRKSKQYPLLVLLFGIVLGHLFWSMPTESVYKDVKCEKAKGE